MAISLDKKYITECGYEVKIYAIYENLGVVHGVVFDGDEVLLVKWDLKGKLKGRVSIHRYNDYNLVEGFRF